ncbi:MAG: restriction endonuclease [Acidobacteria bacterium]|nr:restriction endonuclease [Acidobacteriota bacterium]
MSELEEDEDVIEFDESEMPWETHARRAIAAAAATIEKDEVRGVIYMQSGVDERFFPTQEEFTSWEDIRYTLIELGESEWVNYVPFEGGEPVFHPSVDGFVEDAMSSYGLEDFFESVSPPGEGEELAHAHDLVARRAGLVVQVDLAEINAELVRYLADHPDKMYEMKPRLFEKLVAELFRAKGYDIELGPGRKDGGVDIRAFLRSDIGALLTLIQCKRYGPSHKINVDVVRQLYGVLHRDNATAGIIVTTSTFTRDARSEQQQLEHRIHLAEYAHLTNWLREYPQPGKVA